MHGLGRAAVPHVVAAGALADTCGKPLTLTGTLFGDYSSTLFYLLWRFSPALRLEFGYREEARWVSRYGIVERITKRDPDAYCEMGAPPGGGPTRPGSSRSRAPRSSSPRT